MDEEITLDLKEVFYILKKRIKLIVGITLAFTIITAILSCFVIRPTYEAKTSIIVGKNQNVEGKLDNSDVMMYQNLIKTYAEIAQSDRVAQITAKKLKNKYEPKKIQKMIKVTPQQGTQILEIKAENKDPVEVTNIVKNLSQTFMEESKKVFATGGTIQVMDSPKVPEEPIKPKKLLNIAIAFILGIMASIGTAFILEYTDTTIKNKNDVERYLDMPVIGIIPKNMEN